MRMISANGRYVTKKAGKVKVPDASGADSIPGGIIDMEPFFP